MAEKKKKVFDVAKPGESKPDIGSKPMIVGHKSIANDPMVTTKDSNMKTPEEPSPTKEPVKEDIKEPLKSVKKKITPLSEADKKPAVEEETEDEKAATRETTDTQQDNSDTTDSTKESKDSKTKKLDPAAVAMEQQENLKNIIESKKYFVDIKEQSSGSVRTFLSVFFGLVILGCIALFFLIDAAVLDVDYELPFRIINGS